MAKIYVNGDAQEVSLPLNVSELIQQQNVLQPEMVSVQVNEEFAEREDWESIQLKEGDKVDFLYFMGGGQALDNLTIGQFHNCTIAVVRNSQMVK